MCRAEGIIFASHHRHSLFLLHIFCWLCSKNKGRQSSSSSATAASACPDTVAAVLGSVAYGTLVSSDEEGDESEDSKDQAEVLCGFVLHCNIIKAHSCRCTLTCCVCVAVFTRITCKFCVGWSLRTATLPAFKLCQTSPTASNTGQQSGNQTSGSFIPWRKRKTMQWYRSSACVCAAYLAVSLLLFTQTKCWRAAPCASGRCE